MREEWLEICTLLGFYAAQIGSLHEIMAVWRDNGNTSTTSTSLLLQSYILRYFNGQYLFLCVKFQRQYVKKRIKGKKLHKNPWHRFWNIKEISTLAVSWDRNSTTKESEAHMHAMKANSVVKVHLHTFTSSALHGSSKHGYFPAEGISPAEGWVAINASLDALETRKISCSYRELNHDS